MCVAFWVHLLPARMATQTGSVTNNGFPLPSMKFVALRARFCASLGTEGAFGGEALHYCAILPTSLPPWVAKMMLFARLR